LYRPAGAAVTVTSPCHFRIPAGAAQLIAIEV
jgi:hypothetical protein